MFLSPLLKKKFPFCPMTLAKLSFAISAISGGNVLLCLIADLRGKSKRFTQLNVVLAVYSYNVKRILKVQPNISHVRTEWCVRNTVVLFYQSYISCSYTSSCLFWPVLRIFLLIQMEQDHDRLCICFTFGKTMINYLAR